ncbi:MAG TPA: XrtA system polysaccharide chain length determinant [Stellaceae bacterium]|jgi:polysaccharide chain length determinant protein (PEP-CTERM system associated)|nr:XrtA system polysaccharide chain length determinant [Stellaceae bacterium]
MNSLKSQAMPIVQMLWRQKWLAVGVAWLVCTVGWIGVAIIPTKYESSARVYLNADPLLTPLLHGLAADTDPTRHLDFLQRTLLSRPNLEQLVRLTDLDIGLTTPAQKEQLYKNLAAEVDIRPITPNLMTIAYRSRDPQQAKNVVQSLLTIFAEKTAGSSRSEMDSAQRFLDDEIASYRDQLRAAEKRRAELARQYPDVVSDRPPDAPDTAGDSRSRLDQARAAVAKEKNELDDATTKRNSLRGEIASVPQMVTVDRAPQVVVTGGRALSPDEARLEQMRGNLDTLRLKYTDQHPDVIAARQEIQQLEGEVKHSGSGSAAGGGSGKAQVPNTIYDQLKVKLVDAEGQVATAQRRLADSQAEEGRIEQIARSAPAVMTEAEDLDRDYGVLKKNYQELVSRREATLIADAADTKTEKIQFRIVDPPQVPLVPAEPNRPLLVSVVLLAGLGAGIATPIVTAQLDRSFATITQLRDLGIPVLGSVTRLSLGAARRRATIQLAGVCASAVVLIAVYGTLLVLSLGLHSVSVS